MDGKVFVTVEKGMRIEVPEGTTILEVIPQVKDLLQEKYGSTDNVIAARVDGHLVDLHYKLKKDAKLDFIDAHTVTGRRIIERSYVFLLTLAARDVLGNENVLVEHSYNQGLYGRLRDREITYGELEKIKETMWEYVKKGLKFEYVEMDREEAIELFEKEGRDDKVRLFSTLHSKYVTLYKAEGTDYYDYVFLPLVPDTSYLNAFDLIIYPPGFVLVLPEVKNYRKPAKFEEIVMLYKAFQEHRNWLTLMGLQDVGALNKAIVSGKAKDIIMVAEALQEKKIAQIADMIADSIDDVRLVLIAGPSSSGKTTFSKRLGVQLRVNGIKPIVISTDDYFVPRDKTPRDEEGRPDFDSIKAMDIEFFNQQLMALLKGEEIELPRYNFVRGVRERSGKFVRLEKNSVIVVEGIHALNPITTAEIPGYTKFKIYVSALTQLNIDDHNRIPTTDARLIRRMVRDSLFRGYGVIDTLRQWPLVRRGEDRYIFPYQEEADVFFNSALPYELSVLRPLVEPLLQAVPKLYPEYAEAERLLKFIRHFEPLSTTFVPRTSLLREFVGGSLFEY